MRAGNILSAGENPTAGEAQDYMELLNQLLDASNAERNMIFTVNRYGPFDLTPGKQSYTLGTGQDIDMPRPPRIEAISIINLNNNTQPVELPLDILDEIGWRDIPVKNIGGPLPDKVWDDGGFPFRTLSYWTFPTVAVQTVIYAWSMLQFFPDQATKLTFPPAYLEFLRWNLTLRLDNAKITPQVVALAAESKARIKSFNQPILTLRPDPDAMMISGGSGIEYNWISDTPIYRSGR